MRVCHTSLKALTYLLTYQKMTSDPSRISESASCYGGGGGFASLQTRIGNADLHTLRRV